MSSAPRGLAPREGLELVLMKMGRTGLLLEPRCRPQVGKSGYHRSQNTDRRHDTFPHHASCCYVSNVFTLPNTFALVLDSNLHDLNETNPD